MKLLYISQSIIPSRSANSINVMKMCQAFSRVGHETVLLAPRLPREEEREVDDLYAFYGVDPCFELVRIPYRRAPRRSVIYAVECLRAVLRLKPDIVFGRSLGGCALAAAWGRPTIFDLHMPVWDMSRTERFFFSLLRTRSSLKRLVFITHALRRRCLEGGLLDGEKIIVAPNGADEPGEMEPLGSWPGREGALQAGYAGQLYPGKGLEVVLSLVSRIPAVDFHVIGGEEATIENCRNRLLPPNLFIHGFVTPGEVSRYIDRLDICLLPNQRTVLTYGSSSDRGRTSIADFTSPIKMFEYMAHRKPIAASDLPVLREVLNESNAVLVDPEDTEAWAAALRSLSDPALRERVGGKAYQDFLAGYTWKRRAEKVLEGIVSAR